MTRTEYRNGDPITLTWNGCDGCSPDVINGTLCHEHGCPDHWRDYDRRCWGCGCDFTPTDRHQTHCDEECFD